MRIRRLNFYTNDCSIRVGQLHLLYVCSIGIIDSGHHIEQNWKACNLSTDISSILIYILLQCNL